VEIQLSSVDVVVPCYNYGRFLRGCVETALNQEGVDVRVLIIDDCSPDDTREIGEALAAEDARVTFRRHEVNQGFFRTINEGLFDWASADYCLLLSADDALAPSALARATALMEAQPNVGLTYGWGVLLRGEGAPVGAPETASPEAAIIPGHRFLEHCCEFGNPVITPTAILRTKLQHELGPYDPDLPHTSDYEMWMRAALRSDIGFVDAVFGYYRLHGSNMSDYYKADPSRDLRECMRAVTKVATVLCPDAKQADRLLEISGRRCATIALYAAHRRFEAGDADGSEHFVAFAAEIGYPLGRSRVGRTLLAKRMIGPGGYRLARPLIERLRGKGGEPASVPAAEALEVVGHWPESVGWMDAASPQPLAKAR
jgi:glycosyltransferase involved in cell wall biosynthesis